MKANDWIRPRIDEVKAGLPLFPEPALARIEELLNGQLGERELSEGKLTIIAKELIKKMTTDRLKTEAE